MPNFSESGPPTSDTLTAQTILGFAQDLNYRINYFLGLTRLVGYPKGYSFEQLGALANDSIDALGQIIIQEGWKSLTWEHKNGETRQGLLLTIGFSMENPQSNFQMQILASDSLHDTTPKNTLDLHQVVDLHQHHQRLPHMFIRNRQSLTTHPPLNELGSFILDSRLIREP